MKRYVHLILFSLASLTSAGQTTPQPISQSSTLPQPIYPGGQDQIASYIPHATYPYSDTYGPAPGYEGYLMPAVAAPYSTPSHDFPSSIMPTAQGVLHATLKVFAKIGLFLLGGVALLIIGGVFTTAVCSLTPICTITFAGFKEINQSTVRALVTPEHVASAAAFVENAVDKYQRLQRAAEAKYF